MSELKIAAFMQNAWFPPGTQKHHLDRYITDQVFHRRILRGTMSGRRLTEAFGDTFFDRIWWDNVAPRATLLASGHSATDMPHVERVIAEQGPRLILTFGTQAKEAIALSVGGMKLKVMNCRHPNARGIRQREIN